MPLTNAACTNAKPKDKAYKLFDGDGLYLEVSPKGHKWWRLKYRIAGKESRISLGVYPEVPLAEARIAKDAARKQVRQGIDPAHQRRLGVTASAAAVVDDFETVAREYLAKKKKIWKATHYVKVEERFERDLFPWIGKRPMRGPNMLTSAELLVVLRKIEARGAIDTAHRAMQNVSQVFRYAIPNQRAESDPAPALRGAIPPARHGHFATVKDPDGVGELLRKMQVSRGIVTSLQLNLQPYVFARPTELRTMAKPELDLPRATWRIPAAKMKMQYDHIVPLSWQAVAIIEDALKATAHIETDLVFPGTKNGEPLSDGTLRAALADIGYPGEVQTVHGFRTMASTLLNEHGWPGDMIERQLAHKEEDEVRGAYNHAVYLPGRRVMMQWWADYLDSLRDNKPAPLLPKKIPGVMVMG